MADKFRVQVEPDHLQKLASARPVQAVSELVWNAVDAEATRVDVDIEKDDITHHALTVRDNGHGFTHQDVETLFGRLGGSWKARGSRSKNEGRMLHGKEGKGRFKALAIGRVAEWNVKYRDNKQLLGFKLTILRDNLVDVRVTRPEELKPPNKAGVEVRVTELNQEFRSLRPQTLAQSLTESFALYLTDYSKVKIYVDGNPIDPSELIANRKKLSLPAIQQDGKSYPVELEIIEWKSASERWMFLCNSDGFPFHRIAPKFQTPGRHFSAYLKTRYVDVLQEEGILDLAEMNAALQASCDQATEIIKEYFAAKDVEAAQSIIDEWKAEKVYPYRTEPTTNVEKAERQVFDIVALNVEKHLEEFSTQNTQSKAFQLRMLRQAVERGPEELQHILTEVLDLPEKAQKELSKLLEDTKLTNVINASKLVSDRLKFIHGLEVVLFDPNSKALLKERSQLHRMIADNNTWIFGEEFNLTVDDQSLTEVLHKHRKLIGDQTVIDKPVKRIDGKVGIVDLMLSRSVPRNHADEREHLVVELKRPTVKIGSEEITQAEKYAMTIADDERFRSLKTRWSFWVLSNDLDKYAQSKTRQQNKPRGQVYLSEEGNVTVWVKTWSEIIAECKARLNFVQTHLQANVDRESSLKHLKTTYDKYLKGIAEDEK